MARPIPRHDHSTDDEEEEVTLRELPLGTFSLPQTKEDRIRKVAENDDIGSSESGGWLVQQRGQLVMVYRKIETYEIEGYDE